MDFHDYCREEGIDLEALARGPYTFRYKIGKRWFQWPGKPLTSQELCFAVQRIYAISGVSRIIEYKILPDGKLERWGHHCKADIRREDKESNRRWREEDKNNNNS